MACVICPRTWSDAVLSGPRVSVISYSTVLLRMHPERHVLAPRVRVAGYVPVTGRRTEVAAGHRQPLTGSGFLLGGDGPSVLT